MDGTLQTITRNADADLQAEFDKLISNFSHDVGASMRAISDIPRWILQDVEDAGIELPDEILANLQMLIRQSSRFVQLTQDFATYSRVGREQVITFIDPAKVLEEVLSGFDIGSKCLITNNVSPCQIWISKHDLATLFESIVSNAFKHNDRSKAALTINSSEMDGFVTIEFSDDGPGIREDMQGKIFEMMKTLKSKDQVEGSGLGLAICKKICKIYEGKIWLKSSPPNRGTTFGLVFPIRSEQNSTETI
ncbi:sensor histidine kinase [Roseovarius aestuarii]|nr:HAMP domain-containing sensor histidine kinase [Roseovarius aestuarii]